MSPRLTIKSVSLLQVINASMREFPSDATAEARRSLRQRSQQDSGTDVSCRHLRLLRGSRKKGSLTDVFHAPERVDIGKSRGNAGLVGQVDSLLRIPAQLPNIGSRNVWQLWRGFCADLAAVWKWTIRPALDRGPAIHFHRELNGAERSPGTSHAYRRSTCSLNGWRQR